MSGYAEAEFGRLVVSKVPESHWPVGLPQGLLLVIETLKNVKRYVQYCGDKSSIVAITNKGELDWTPSAEIEHVESFLEKVDEFRQIALEMWIQARHHEPAALQAWAMEWNAMAFSEPLRPFRERLGLQAPQNDMVAKWRQPFVDKGVSIGPPTSEGD